MTIHVVTSPGVISRKNAKRYLSEHLIFPATVTTIEEEAFHGCNHLKVLEIAHEPRYIGERVVNRSTKIRCYKNSKVDVYCQKNQILAEYIEK